MTAAYHLRLARADELRQLQAVERSAAVRFAGVGYPVLAEADPLPLETLRPAQQENRLWVAALRAMDAPVGFALAEVLDAHAHLAEMDVLPQHGR